jgi:hypothetical protein
MRQHIAALHFDAASEVSAASMGSLRRRLWQKTPPTGGKLAFRETGTVDPAVGRHLAEGNTRWQRAAPSLRDKTFVTTAAASCSSPGRNKRDREVDELLVQLEVAPPTVEPPAKRTRAGGWARGRSQFLGPDGYFRWKCPKCPQEIVVQNKDDTSAKAFNAKRQNHKHNIHKGEWKAEADARTTVLGKPIMEAVDTMAPETVVWKCPVA